MRLLFLFATVTVLFMSCSQKNEKIETKAPVLMASYGNEANEWTNLYNARKDANAHTGSAVAFLDSVTAYSVGYSNALGNISKTKIDSVTFSYWVFLKSDKAQAKTVLSIGDNSTGKNILWLGNLLSKKVNEYNKWVEVTETFKIPANMDPKYIMSIYVWNNSKEEILLDDFKVEFY